MIEGKKIVVVMPAYNASRTLKQTLDDIPKGLVDDIILVDDASSDNTVDLAHKLGIQHVLQHQQNTGYGGNQKSCYQQALKLGADIVIMLHPDYQYSPKLIPSMAYLIAYDVYPVVLGSRILGGHCLRDGMPLYKYIANRILTLFQNILLHQKLSEYHTGYRAYDACVLRAIPFMDNSNDFVFDNQLLAQCFGYGFPIGEISCPTKYFPEASSINLKRSIRYGLGVLKVSLAYRFLRKYHSPKIDLRRKT